MCYASSGGLQPGLTPRVPGTKKPHGLRRSRAVLALVTYRAECAVLRCVTEA